MKIIFKLSMPNVGSWNGVWTGKKENYFLARDIEKNKAIKILEQRYFHYNFGDGWSAQVHVHPSKDFRSLKSAGFCGYDWMVDSIIDNLEIKT